MKLSRYTSILPIGENTKLIFSASTQTFHILKDLNCEINYDNLLQWAQGDEAIRQELITSKVLIDDDVDEVKWLKDKIFKIDNDSSLFQLNINPTLDCNFRCWYCYENHQKESRMSEQTIESVIRFVENTFNRLTELKEFNLGFFGGEPLLCFDTVVKPLIHKLGLLCKQHDVSLAVNFTSNGNLITEEIIKFLRGYRTSFQITLDGDMEHHDKTRFSKGGEGSFLKIIENIKLLVSNRISVIVRINYTRQNAVSIQNITKYFSELNPDLRDYMVFDFHRVWQERDNHLDQTDEIIGEIKSQFRTEGFKVSAFIYRDFTQSCYGDKTNHVLINYNGEVFGCTARDFISANRIGMLHATGEIEYDQPVYGDRATAKFSKEVCHNCRIAPICQGGCRQRAYEARTNGNRCTYNYDDNIINAKILDIFDRSFC